MPNGITADTNKRIVLDAGALYADYGEAGQRLLGSTKGGSVFTVQREDRMVELDGARGKVVGLNRPIEHTAMLETTLMEVTREILIDLMLGTSVSDGTHFTITPSNTIALADYLTNIALAADVMNTTDLMIVKLLNAIAVDGFTFTLNDKNEGEVSAKFEANYASATGFGTPPYEIMIPVATS